MKIKDPLRDSVIRRNSRVGRTTGDLGIELELEGVSVLESINEASRSFEFKYWAQHPENSLRDGTELVLAKPIDIDKLPEALDEVRRIIGKGKVVNSIRTSTHFHVNILDLTFYELYTMLGFYYLVEDLLVEVHGKFRKGNLFCLRASDAFGCITACTSGIAQHGYPLGNQEMLKYGALNLYAPFKYGSVEFRFPRGADSLEFVDTWARGLYDLVHKTSKMDLQEFLANFRYDAPAVMVRAVLPKSLADIVLEQVSANLLQAYLESGIKRARIISRALETETFKAPSVRLDNEDLDEKNLLSRDHALPATKNETKAKPASAKKKSGYNPSTDSWIFNTNSNANF